MRLRRDDPLHVGRPAEARGDERARRLVQPLGDLRLQDVVLERVLLHPLGQRLEPVIQLLLPLLQGVGSSVKFGKFGMVF